MSYFRDFMDEDTKEEKDEKKPQDIQDKKTVTNVTKKTLKHNTHNKKETKNHNKHNKLTQDKSLNKDDIITYIIRKIKNKRKKYTLDYLRAMKYNLDAIDLAKD